MTDKLFYDNSPEDKSFLVPLLNVGFLVLRHSHRFGNRVLKDIS